MKKNSHLLFDPNPGNRVLYKGQESVITDIVGNDQVIVSDLMTHEKSPAKLSELVPVPPKEIQPRPELGHVSDKKWEAAKEKFEIIKPLLDLPKRTKALVEQRAQEFGLSPFTLYKWLATYEDSGLLTSLLPREKGTKGTTNLAPEVEAVIKEVIDREYLTSQRKNIQKICTEVLRRCHVAGLPAPHPNTVRNRINALSLETRMARRYGKKIADQHFEPIKGKFPEPKKPLEVVQIDHTKLDLMLVDDIHRISIGRPWITLAIDIFSRMVYGFYVSFDPPSALSAGLCLAHGILPKDEWLARHGVQGKWSCQGLPEKLHMDNAKEFRGRMLQRACLEYGIEIEWRPVARPQFGGHIERLLGTLLQEIHTLPGTTFSNTQEKGRYDSEGKAVMTLTEFEAWFTEYIVNIYHARVHSYLKTSPAEKYWQGIRGTQDGLPAGLPQMVGDKKRLLLDFMPFEERTIQNYGVAIDEIYYYHDVLRRWINATDPENPKLKRKFIFRRDPRDISEIWFYDPELSDYFRIPYRDTSHPSMSVWELRAAKERLEQEGRKNMNEADIFGAHTRLRDRIAESDGKTKAATRARQKKALKAGTTVKEETAAPSGSRIPSHIDLSKIRPFEDLDNLR